MFIYTQAAEMNADMSMLGDMVIQAFDYQPLLRTVPMNVRKIVAKVLSVFYNKVQ